MEATTATKQSGTTSERTRSERKLGWMLCAPAVFAMLLVTAYPIGYAIVLSLQELDLRFPEEGGFAGLSNYEAVLTSSLWWQDVFNTLFVTIISVALELTLGMLIALAMHRAIFGRGVLRTSVLIPYGIVTVVAAFSWQFAFAPDTGFVNNLPLIDDDKAWFGERFSSFAVVIMAEVWKTTRLGLAAVLEDHGAAHEAGDPGRTAVQDPGRVPDLRHDLHHDRRGAGHRVGLDPWLQPADRAIEPGPGLGRLGVDLLQRLPDRVPVHQGVRRADARGEARYMSERLCRESRLAPLVRAWF
jgi:hypothetical protein